VGWIAEGVIFGGMAFAGYPALALGTGIGYFLGQFIDPDLDLVGITSSEGRMLRKIPVLGSVSVAYWTMYGAAFRRLHRSKWTHSYVFSTLLRFLYGFWPLYFLHYTAVWFLWVVFGMFVGLCVSDALHIYLDKRTGEMR